MDAFQPNAFDHDVFQVLERTSTIEQTAPNFTQSADVELESVDTITQAIPSFTQHLTATTAIPVEPEEPGLGGGIFLAPGSFKQRNPVKIRQKIPMFTQHLSAEVNDDELVLLLMI